MSNANPIDVGDRVEVLRGQWAECQGVVTDAYSGVFVRLDGHPFDLCFNDDTNLRILNARLPVPSRRLP